MPPSPPSPSPLRPLLAVAMLAVIQIGVSSFYWIPDARPALMLAPTWDAVLCALFIAAFSFAPPLPRWAERLVGVVFTVVVVLTVAVAFGQGILQRLFGRDLVLALDLVFVKALLKMIWDADTLFAYWSMMAGIILGLLLLLVGPYLCVRYLRGHLHGHPRRQLGLAGGALAYLAIGALVAGVHAPVAPIAAAQLAMVINTKDPLATTARRLEEEGASNKTLALPNDAAHRAERPRHIYLIVVEAYGNILFSGANPRFVDFPGFLAGKGSELAQAGYSVRSRFMRSPVFGGGSWMSDASLICGVSINNQKRFVSLFQSQVRCLPKFLRDGGYRTVLAMPSTQNWDDALLAMYGFDKFYFKRDFPYVGPRIGWAFMPDQYVLDYMQRTEMRPHADQPLFVTMVLTSSHVPWAAVPPLVEWDLGDGARFKSVTPLTFPNGLLSGRDYSGGYHAGVRYSITTITDFLQRLPPDDKSLVIVVGDHQPQTPVASRWKDVRWVPMHVISRDAKAVDAFAPFGLETGILPPTPTQEPEGNDRVFSELLLALGAQSSEAGDSK